MKELHEIRNKIRELHDVFSECSDCLKDEMYSLLDNLRNKELQLIEELDYIKKYDKKVFIEIMVNLSSRDNLSRPDKLPKENKNGFMKKIEDNE